MAEYINLKNHLLNHQYKWLVTGVAGFIGSNILEELLKLNQIVIGLDNFSTGHHKNLIEVQSLFSSEIWANFTFIEGDICNSDDCSKACQEIDFVLQNVFLWKYHQHPF